MSATSALRFAFNRAVTVLWGGLIAFAMYVSLVTFGPGIDGRFLPVIKDYRLIETEALGNGGFAFVPEFRKVRDCTYFGITWFAPDERGNLARIQGRRESNDAGPPETGPVGERIGNKQILYPPPGATEIFGIMHHDCGFIWQTRTQVGPFKITGGHLASTR